MNITWRTARADHIDPLEVEERVNWQDMRQPRRVTLVIVDAATLEFLPNGPHQVAAMANLGAELLQEIQAYRPQFLFKSSPAEIVGALIEEMVAPTVEATPQLAPGEREEFDAWFGDTSKRGYVHNEVSAYSGWLAAKRAALAAAPVQPVAVPDVLEEPTYMTEDQGRDWAWKDVKKGVGTKGWTAGDNGNFFGFFLHGWNYRGQFEKQRAAPAAQGDAKELEDKVTGVLEGYADNYDMMARVGKTGDADCRSVAHDIRRNMVDAVRAAFAASKAVKS